MTAFALSSSLFVCTCGLWLVFSTACGDDAASMSVSSTEQSSMADDQEGTQDSENSESADSGSDIDNASDESQNSDSSAASVEPNESQMSDPSDPSPQDSSVEEETEESSGTEESSDTEESSETEESSDTKESSDTEESPSAPDFDLPYEPLYRIDARIHVGSSDLSDDELKKIFEEMNSIWLSQAAVCFEFEVVDHDETRSDGFDFWFIRNGDSRVGDFNGVYRGDHDILSRDELA